MLTRTSRQMIARTGWSGSLLSAWLGVPWHQRQVSQT